MSLLILFGPTGAGKTFVGQLLKQKLNYHFYDGDTDLTPEIKKALNNMQPITSLMRDQFINRLLSSIGSLQQKHSKLVVAQAFIQEKHRQQLLKKFPQAQFILINTPQTIRHQRRKKRALYPWSQAYVSKMDRLFEAPKIKHLKLSNSISGQQQLVNQLKRELSF